jgi:phospholipase/lecithinase/hemolysin
VKNRIPAILFVLTFIFASFKASAAFTSIHVFGDTLSCTASNTTTGVPYYGKRYSNGRIWVEVLANNLGIAFNPTNNPNAFYGNTSDYLAVEISAYVPPSDASNALVVIWVNDADLFYPATASPPTPANFNAVINLALTNQFNAITNLYAKGIRTLIMPTAVDICTVPALNTYTLYTNLYHQAATNYNALFAAMLDKARVNYPDLTIVSPDFFGLLANLLKYPAKYGVTNALNNNLSTDALEDPNMSDYSLNGPGASYVFWDYIDPTAKVHNLMGILAQQLLVPLQISGITQVAGSNRLDIVNVPIVTNGVGGIVLGSTDPSAGIWTTNGTFNSTNVTQSVFVPMAGPQWFYRLSFPPQWTWP